MAAGRSYVINYVNFGDGYGRQDTQLSNLSICFRVLTEQKTSAIEMWSHNLGNLSLPPRRYNSAFPKLLLARSSRQVGQRYSPGLPVAAGEFYAFNSDNSPSPLPSLMDRASVHS
jgi:hypothetical protein